MTLSKTEDRWPIECLIEAKEVTSGRWSVTQWQWADVILQPSSSGKPEGDAWILALELFRDERTDYRFNLSSQQPKLFLAIEEENERLKPITLTASQSIAGNFLDGDYLVLSIDMPLAIQAWMEAYIGRHGELLEQRRKKRKGAGRSSGK
ncbi:DUF3305 domain-containing protein [Vibrio tapetis]|uniref:DUF3305 domain-containing protein n=1 Tax=Vibrio tapetis subsp. tapetis TaxID=1671868 RepID=A0A2N8Z9U7_9VIBR|nr:DUF3305 domain-containing protein [Vibrio tapetis]SON48662.1 conserved protein of unknown function [Vibrio tapetis subsp. tapetis]